MLYKGKNQDPSGLPFFEKIDEITDSMANRDKKLITLSLNHFPLVLIIYDPGLSIHDYCYFFLKACSQYSPISYQD